MSKRGRKVTVGSSHQDPPVDPYAELIQSPREVAAQDAQEKASKAPAVVQEPRGSGGVPPELSLEEVQAIPKAERRPTNFALPKRLELHRRMTYYKADHDVQIQDQIAVATDRWLREQGY